jgi:hypothetical protein
MPSLTSTDPASVPMLEALLSPLERRLIQVLRRIDDDDEKSLLVATLEFVVAKEGAPGAAMADFKGKLAKLRSGGTSLPFPHKAGGR